MKIHLTTTPGALAATLQSAIVEINRGLWHVRKNQGSEGAAGIIVELPEFIDVEMEVIAASGLNAIPRTSTSAAGAGTTTETRVEGQQITQQTSGESRQGNTTSTQTAQTTTARGGSDSQTETMTYES